MAAQEVLSLNPPTFFEQRKNAYYAYCERLLNKLQSGGMTQEEYLERLARALAVKDDRLRAVSQDALTDHLTGAPNSRAIDLAFDHIRKTGTPEAVFLIDVDNLKNGNVELGHRATNEAIIEVIDAAEIAIEGFVRDPIEIMVLRRGEQIPAQGIMRMHTRGDEFLVFTKGLKTQPQRKQFAEFLRNTYFNSSPVQTLNRRTSRPFSISVVGALYSPDQDAENFINTLSLDLLSTAKAQGKNKSIVL